MDRRKLLLSVPLALLAGCGGGTVADVVGKIPIKIELPPELQESFNDVVAIIKKVEPLAGQIGEVAGIVSKAKEMVASVTNSNAVGILSSLSSWMGPLVGLVKPFSGTVSTAIATLLPMIGGSRTSGRTGMTPHQARAVLRS